MKIDFVKLILGSELLNVWFYFWKCVCTVDLTCLMLSDMIDFAFGIDLICLNVVM